MAKKIASHDRNSAPVISHVPVRIREQLDQIAERKQVSVSSIGRSLFTKYVEKQTIGEEA